MSTSDELFLAIRAIDEASPKYAIEFERILSEIFSLKEPNTISQALLLLDDRCVFDELMFSVIHGIEEFDDDIYVHHILEGFAILYARDPKWASVIVMRILNSENCRRELTRQVQSFDTNTKAIVKTVLERIADRRSEFLAKASEVLSAAR